MAVSQWLRSGQSSSLLVLFVRVPRSDSSELCQSCRPTMLKTNINVTNLSKKILHWTISSLAYHQTLNAMVFFSTIEQIDDPNDKFEIIAGLKISTFDETENLKRKIEVIAGCPNFAAVAAVVALAKNELDELLPPDAALESSEYEVER
jgi:hypothetical protein